MLQSNQNIYSRKIHDPPKLHSYVFYILKNENI
jgi:hypothetical protein